MRRERERRAGKDAKRTKNRKIREEEKWKMIRRETEARGLKLIEERGVATREREREGQQVKKR